MIDATRLNGHQWEIGSKKGEKYVVCTFCRVWNCLDVAVERKITGSWFSTPPARTCEKCAATTFPDATGKKSVEFVNIHLVNTMAVLKNGIRPATSNALIAVFTGFFGDLEGLLAFSSSCVMPS